MYTYIQVHFEFYNTSNFQFWTWKKKKNKREMAYPERRFPPLEGMDPAILTCPLAIGATGKATEPGISDAISVR